MIPNKIRNQSGSSEEESSSDEELRTILNRKTLYDSRIIYLDDDGATSDEANDEQLRTTSKRTTFDTEYYKLPPIEKLSINVKEEDKLEKFGKVDSQVDFIVMIKPLDGSPHLGYETVLFDAHRNPLGEIFEIFGTVSNTMYALRFNTKEEAEEKLPLGSDIYYIISNCDITKPIFPQELAKIKTWDRCRTHPEQSSSSEELFSDDEEERRHQAKKKQKSRQRNSVQIIDDSCSADGSHIEPQRKRMRGRNEDVRKNAFHPQHSQWQKRQFYPQQGATMQQQYPYAPYQYAYAPPYQYQHQFFTFPQSRVQPVSYYAQSSHPQFPNYNYQQQQQQQIILPPPPPPPPSTPPTVEEIPMPPSSHQFFNS